MSNYFSLLGPQEIIKMGLLYNACPLQDEAYDYPVAVYPAIPEPAIRRKRDLVRMLIRTGRTYSEYFMQDIEQLAQEMGLLPELEAARKARL
jgi:hypothetical protein